MNRRIINRVWAAATLYKMGREKKAFQNLDRLKKTYPEHADDIDRLFDKHLSIIEIYGFCPLSGSHKYNK